MTKLAFVVPTWKRPEHLIRCVDSIAEQITDWDEVGIHIVQDGEEEGTVSAVLAICGKWPNVKVTHNPHTDYSGAFRAMFRAEPEAEWVWTFGDDDVLRPDSLEFMIDQLKGIPADFIHVCEAKRASGVNNIYSADSLLKLCCHFGWIEMTGFITCNITRGSVLAKAAETPRWRSYAKTAFVQSCILLEALKDRPAVFMDIPLVDSQEREQTKETSDTWAQQNIPGRYLILVDAMEVMYEEGILTNKLPPKFFRYLCYHLWDRYLTHFISDFLNHEVLWDLESWNRVMRFAQFIDDEAYAKHLLVEVEAARGLTTILHYMAKNVEGLRNELGAIFHRHATTPYPASYVEVPTVEATSVAVQDQPGSDRTEASPAG